MLSYIVFVLFFLLLLPFTKVLGPIDQLPKDSSRESYERTLVPKKDFSGHKWSNIAKQKKEEKKFAVFANHPAVYSGGVSRGRVHGCGCWR